MTDLRNAGAVRGLSCPCAACTPPLAMSRRQFLCTGTGGAIAVASAAGTLAASSGAARAQQPGRPLLIKGGCVLTLDRSIGDFETADVLIEGKKISAVRPNITAPDAEIIDASRTRRHPVMRMVRGEGTVLQFVFLCWAGMVSPKRRRAAAGSSR